MGEHPAPRHMDGDMKAIICGICADVRALRDSSPVTCECGNVTGWWVDAARGTAKVFARERDKAKIMGIMNMLVVAAFRTYDYAPAKWRELHDEMTASAKGYVFHREQRNCPVAIIGVGNSADVSWADELPGASRAQGACSNCNAQGPDVRLIREGDGPVLCARCNSGIAPC